MMGGSPHVGRQPSNSHKSREDESLTTDAPRSIQPIPPLLSPPPNDHAPHPEGRGMSKTGTPPLPGQSCQTDKYPGTSLCRRGIKKEGDGKNNEGETDGHPPTETSMRGVAHGLGRRT